MSGDAKTAADRPSGYYWIAGTDEPEPARWDADDQVWHVIGTPDALDDVEVEVVEGPIFPTSTGKACP
jgi:hypothetical protein